MVTRVQTNKRTERPFTGRDVDQGEQPHARVPAHRPLLGLTVGLAAVVHEARLVALGPGIDDPVLEPATQSRSQRLRMRRRSDIDLIFSFYMLIIGHLLGEIGGKLMGNVSVKKCL